MPTSTVIGICGPPGSGKTTLALGLTRALPSASALFFDHYEQVTEQPLEDIVAWLEAGADCNVFAIPGLAKDLARLKRGEPITDPRTGARVEPTKYLVFETPFGREHRATGDSIDLLVWIDIPLDVALARNVRAFTESFLTAHGPDELADHMRWLKEHMEEYLSAVRRMLVRQREAVPGAADIRIDGEGDPDRMVHNVAREVMLAVARREASS